VAPFCSATLVYFHSALDRSLIPSWTDLSGLQRDDTVDEEVGAAVLHFMKSEFGNAGSRTMSMGRGQNELSKRREDMLPPWSA